MRKAALTARQDMSCCAWVPEQCHDPQHLANPFREQTPGRLLKNAAQHAAALHETLCPDEENVVEKGKYTRVAHPITPITKRRN